MIKVLEKNVSDKIAAGEVVENPVSIVKELFENSIDAKSDNIIVEIEAGGKSLIRITDNGCGIESDDVGRAFLRHATSKLSSIEDLNNLFTLGFRGEALASIAAVSRVQMLTKTKAAKSGVKFVIEGGQQIEQHKCGCPDGTTIIVKDLFFNTPAREKFLSSDRAEAAKIIEFVSHMALAYPDIKIKMINNGNVLFATSGRGDRLTVIATVENIKSPESLIRFTEEKDGMKLSGYISDPGESKANRRGQIFFVNGRAVKDKLIRKGIDLAYSDRLFEGRFPITYLFLDVAPDSLDVNIHPNKREIRFLNEEAIIDFVKKSIMKALKSKEAIPELKTLEPSFKRKDNSSFTDIFYGKPKHVEGLELSNNNLDIKENKTRDSDDLKSENHSETDLDREISTFKSALGDFREKLVSSQNEEDLKVKETISKILTPETLDFSTLEVVAQIFLTYILLKDENFIYIVDQHAAQERVFFEKFKEHFEKYSGDCQLLLIGFTLEVEHAHNEMFSDCLEYLTSIGFRIQDFGPGTYKVEGIPTIFNEEIARDFLEDFISNIEDLSNFDSKTLLDKTATKACKAAIKGNDKLSVEQMYELMKDLNNCKNPYSCPHGRPTFLKITKSQLESRFNRK